MSSERELERKQAPRTWDLVPRGWPLHGAASVHCALSSSVADPTAICCDNSPRDHGALVPLHGLERPSDPGSRGW